MKNIFFRCRKRDKVSPITNITKYILCTFKKNENHPKRDLEVDEVYEASSEEAVYKALKKIPKNTPGLHIYSDNENNPLVLKQKHLDSLPKDLMLLMFENCLFKVRTLDLTKLKKLQDLDVDKCDRVFWDSPFGRIISRFTIEKPIVKRASGSTHVKIDKNGKIIKKSKIGKSLYSKHLKI
jgi:hypothetical protein